MPPRERGFPYGFRMNRNDYMCCAEVRVEGGKSSLPVMTKEESMKLTKKSLTNCLVFGLVLAAGSIYGLAQTATKATNVSPGAAGGLRQATNPPGDVRYRIGPGDVLEVRVARAPDLSRDAVRVDQSGNIRMPMLEVDIPAACLTEVELADNIAKLYRKYKNDPHVDVFVKEFQSQPVAVMGAVRNPSQFKLQRQVRLLELLTLVGGQTANAGQRVQIVHAGGPSLCEKQSNDATDDGFSSAMVSFNLEDTLRGLPEANPFVRPGDVIQIPEADQVFVLGNVLKPTAIALTEPLTVSKAIAIAGGTAPATKKDKIRIIRQVPGQTAKQEIPVDLEAIEKNRATDVALMPNDIVNVPISGTKSFLRSLMGTIVPTVSQLPVRVIP
jgi:polysaccharide biosynthesis/export protein